MMVDELRVERNMISIMLIVVEKETRWKEEKEETRRSAEGE